MKDMNWYLDTRKYGSCPHAGFGLLTDRTTDNLTNLWEQYVGTLHEMCIRDRTIP